MEINYELIIKYLTKKDSSKNNFITQKNIYSYSTNFPDKFKEYLTDKYYRYGITVYDNENNNIKKLLKFFKEDSRNKDGKFFSEIYDNKFLHYR